MTDDILPSQSSENELQTRLARRKRRKPGFARNLAFIVGINDYTNTIPPLQTAVDDAEALKAVLEKEHDYKVELLTDDKATREKLVSALDVTRPDSWASQVGSRDRVIFYFAGHGVADEGEDGPAGYILPHDADPERAEATFVQMRQLHDLLLKLECHHMLLILDCCFAGRMRWSTLRAVHKQPKLIHRQRYEHYIESPAWHLFTSAAYDQTALDVLQRKAYSPKRPKVLRESTETEHSPFAYALLESLSGGIADIYPDGKGDGLLTAYELYQHIDEQVWRGAKAVNHQQTPEFWPLKKHRNGMFLFRVPGRELDLAEAEALTLDRNPYRGLKSFEGKHHKFFFGREQVIGALLSHITTWSLTVVLGASGTGKSSLVKAGLLPVLQGVAEFDPENLPETEKNTLSLHPDEWQVLSPIRPTQSPFQALGQLLAEASATPQPNLQADHPHALAKYIASWVQTNPNKKLVLTLDQFEEMITACHNETERRRFLELLAEAVATQSDHFRLILTLRTDFEPQLANLGLKAFWEAARFIVPALTSSELREIIEGPASEQVLYFEPPELVEQLIEEVNQTPGALPLLSFALSQMYINYVGRKSETRAITEADYAALGGDETLGGGVVGALQNQANRVYEQLTQEFPEESRAYQETMQRVMLRMVSVDGNELARRRVLLSELEYHDPAENDQVNLVIDRLREARLLVQGSTKNADDQAHSYVEPAHDALVRAWDRLTRWHQARAEELPLQRRLTQAAVLWANETDPAKQNNRLWHYNPGLPRLEQIVSGEASAEDYGPLRHWWHHFVELWQSQPLVPKQTGHWLNKLELHFVQESVRQRQRNARWLVGSVAGVMVVLTALMIFAFVQQGRAETQRVAAVTAEANAEEGRIAAENAEATAVAERDISRARQLAAQSEIVPVGQSSQSLLLALEALRTYQSSDIFLAEPRRALYAALQRPSGRPLGRLGITSDRIVFSPDQRWLAAGDADGGLHLWSLADLDSPVNVWSAHDDRINVLAFSPDGQWLASGDFETIRVWSLLEFDSQPVVEIEINAALAIAFSPDIRWLFIASEEGTISQKSMTDLQAAPQVVAADDDAFISELAFSANGQWLAARSGIEETYLWPSADLADDPEVLRINELNSVEAIRFSPDSQWLLSAGATDVRLWSLTEPDKIDPVVWPGTESEVFTVAFSPDSRHLAAGSYAQTVHLWAVDNPAQPPAILENGEVVIALAFSPDGQALLSAGEQGTVREWSLNRPQQAPLALFGQDEQGSNLVAVSPDGQWLAATNRDQVIQLLPTNNLQAEPLILTQSEGGVLSLVFSIDSQWLMAGSETGQIWRWSLANSQVMGEILFEHDAPIFALAVTPDGSGLASSDLNGGVQLWSLTGLGASPQELPSDDVYEINNLAFSPDGQWLAGGEIDGPIVWVWSLNDLAEPVMLQAAGMSGVVVDFSSDGQYLAAGNEADTIQLWSTADSFTSPARVLRGHTDFVHSLAFSFDGQWLASGSIDGTIRLWPLSHFGDEPVILQGYDNGNQSLAFSPDGQWLLVGTENRPAHLWPMNIEEVTTLACQYAGRNFTLAEWDLYFRGEPYRQTCPEWPLPLADIGDVTE